MRQVRRCPDRPCTQSLSWRSKSARSLMHANWYVVSKTSGQCGGSTPGCGHHPVVDGASVGRGHVKRC